MPRIEVSACHADLNHVEDGAVNISPGDVSIGISSVNDVSLGRFQQSLDQMEETVNEEVPFMFFPHWPETPRRPWQQVRHQAHSDSDIRSAERFLLALSKIHLSEDWRLSELRGVSMRFATERLANDA